jgi:hypothetical protein
VMYHETKLIGSFAYNKRDANSLEPRIVVASTLSAVCRLHHRPRLRITSALCFES